MVAGPEPAVLGAQLSTTVTSAVPAVHGLLSAAGAAALHPGGLLGRTVADYIDELMELHRPMG